MEELLDSLGGSGFINMTRRPLSDSLLELGVSQRFIDEVIAPVMRVNYGQNVSIPAFVGQTRGRRHVGGLMCSKETGKRAGRTQLWRWNKGQFRAAHPRWC